VSTVGVNDDRTTSRERDAVRILLVIAAAAVPFDHRPNDDPVVAAAVGVVETQVRLQKLDFWVRNPDYLADELLNEYERRGDPELVETASAIMHSDEPEVRRYPMLRFLFGAYEPLDDALAVLRSADLVVRRRRGSQGHVQQTDYFLTELGARTARRIVREVPTFAYFADRTALVVSLFEDLGGTQLKTRQYAQVEYRDTAIGDRIATIAPRVRERLARVAAVQATETPGGRA
jgi:hypothetical protein